MHIRNRILRRLPTLTLALVLAAPGLAGWVANGTVTRGAEKGTLKQFFQNESARLDLSLSAKNASFVYHAPTGKIVWIDHQKKSYLEVNKVDLDRMLMLIAGFLKQPPALAAGDVSFKKVASLQSLGKWKCTRYHVAVKNKVTGDFCVVPMESVGASAKDYRAVEALIQTVLKLGVVPAAERTALESVAHALKLGFIVQSTDLDPSGKKAGDWLAEKVVTQKLADSTFAAPAGYQHQDITSLLQKQISGK